MATRAAGLHLHKFTLHTELTRLAPARLGWPAAVPRLIAGPLKFLAKISLERRK